MVLPIRTYYVGILMKSQSKRGRKPCSIVEIQRTLCLGWGYFTLALFKKVEWLFLTTPFSTSHSGRGIQTSFCKRSGGNSGCVLLSVDIQSPGETIVLCQIRRNTPRFLLITLRTPRVPGARKGHFTSSLWGRYCGSYSCQQSLSLR